MKKTNLLIVAILLFFGLNAQEQREKATWDYPIKPGMEEWKTLKTHNEMVKVCQIPEEILIALSTEDLTNLCVECPLLFEMFVFNYLHNGIQALFRDFNGIRELYKRENMAQYLIKRYDEKIQELSLLDDKIPDSSRSDLLVSLSEMEVLLSLVDGQNKEGYKKILQSLVKGYEVRANYGGDFSVFGVQYNFYARGNIISKIDHPLVNKLSQQEKSVSLLNTGIGGGDRTLINKLSYELIK